MTRQTLNELTLTLKILLRQPGFWIPTVLFPAMFYAFFGAQSSDRWAASVMASFTVYAVLGVGFYQFGVSVAQDRESPFARWQRSLPGGAVAQWIARVLASLVFVAIAVVLVVGMAFLFDRVEVGAAALLRLLGICLIAAVAATVMGIALGSLTSARAAVPIANLIYLPLAYLGGLWVPPIALPSVINSISQWTPTRAMGELSWAAIDGRALDPWHLGLLAAWTAVAAGIAIVGQVLVRRSGLA
ncbi:MAG: ABC transporter permease [Pseudomonadota bacterium]